MEIEVDLTFADHGSIWLVRAETDRGREWLAEHLPEDTTWLGGAACVEWRYVTDIIEGAQIDGLEIGS